jgi:hypothetical protein
MCGIGTLSDENRGGVPRNGFAIDGNDPCKVQFAGFGELRHERPERRLEGFGVQQSEQSSGTGVAIRDLLASQSTRRQ